MNSTANQQGIDIDSLKRILEASLLAAGEPLSIPQMAALFGDTERPSGNDFRQALSALSDDCEDRGIELIEVASGWRLQIRQSLHLWVSKMWTEKPQRYSRALLETLSLIAYRQPITRGDIEDVRGVSVSSNIIRTLQERDWIRVIGHRDVPGKPALLGTTRAFLDYFNLKSLDQLPTLAEIKEMVNPEPELDLEGIEKEKARREAEIDASKQAQDNNDDEDNTDQEADQMVQT